MTTRPRNLTSTAADGPADRHVGQTLKPADVLVTVRFPQPLVVHAREVIAPWTITLWDPASHGPVPADVWRQTQVLYTHDVIPPRPDVPNLRVVQLDTAGSDQLRGTWLWESDLTVTTLAGIAPPATAGYTFAMMLAHAHRIPRLLAHQSSRDWPDMATRRQQLTPRLLDEAHLGVLGYGRIGREIGRLGRAFGMTVHGMRRSSPGGTSTDSDPDIWWQPGDLPSMVAGCDFLVIALPHTRQTHHLVDEDVVAAIKNDAFVVNIGRGGVVAEAPLLDRLDTGTLAGVAFDVFESEPLKPSSRWWDTPGALISPHVAGFNPRYEQQAIDILCDNVQRLRTGQPLTNRLDRTRGY